MFVILPKDGTYSPALRVFCRVCRLKKCIKLKLKLVFEKLKYELDVLFVLTIVIEVIIWILFFKKIYYVKIRKTVFNPL
jgi:hypothetical protein